MATRQPPDAEPYTFDDAACADGVGHVRGTGWMKPAGAGEERRKKQLIGAQRAKRQLLRKAELTAIALAHRAVPRSRHTPTRGCLTKQRTLPGAARRQCGSRAARDSGEKARGRDASRDYVPPLRQSSS